VIAAKIRPYVTDAVLDQYYRVFEYERLKHLNRRRIARLRGLIESASVKVKPRGRLKVSDHEEDNWGKDPATENSPEIQ
jgi:hypothetical protein